VKQDLGGQVLGDLSWRYWFAHHPRCGCDYRPGPRPYSVAASPRRVGNESAQMWLQKKLNAIARWRRRS